MSLMTWNCCGLKNPQAVLALHLLVRQDKPNILCLMETKLSQVDLEKIKWKLGFRYGLGVNSDGRKGGLGIMWSEEVEVSIKSYSANFIDYRVKEAESLEEWRFTLFYGDPVVTNRHISWDMLKFLNNDQSILWALGGDFNKIISIEEKIGAENLERQMMAFRDALDVCGLKNLGYMGYKYNWSNRRSGDSNIQERLDRFAANITSLCWYR